MPLDQPLISFVVSVYNLERYIGECLDSILCQPFDDYELILVNNNSKDRSDAICRDYASRYKQIRYYALTGEPIIGKAIAYGLNQVRGKYIQVVDGDDTLCPDTYGEVSEILRTKGPDVLFGRFDRLFEGDVVNFTDRFYQPEKINGKNKDDALLYLAENQPLILSQWRLVILSSIVLACKGNTKVFTKATNMHEDVYISVYSLVQARSIYYVDKNIYRYRVRNSSISRITLAKQVSECADILIDLAKIYNTLAKTHGERNFIHTYMEQFRYQLAASLCAMDEKEFAEGVSDIERSLEYRNLCHPIEENVSEIGYPLGNELLQEGVSACLARHQQQYLEVISEIGRKLSQRQRAIYMAPTGNIGTYIKTALEAQGLKISGFFDNDPQKEGMIISGAPVYLPNAIGDISAGGSITVIIATRYENVYKELQTQFLSLGINEDAIYVVKF